VVVCAKYFGVHHKNRQLEAMNRTYDVDALREWKRRQAED
jgi:hypothetical protein